MAKDPLDPLFAAPLDEFVATRNRLASELRKNGDGKAADEVKAMRKPSAVVWAVNQLARTEARDVGRLLELTERMREVQSGRSDASFADAQRALSDAAWELAASGAELLEAGGKRPSPAVSQRLGRALLAAAASPETSELLRAGRLLEEPEPVGFGGIGSVAPRRAGRRGTPRKVAARERRETKQEAARKERLDAAKRELRDAKAEAARLSREAERAQERVVELERRVARLGPS